MLADDLNLGLGELEEELEAVLGDWLIAREWCARRDRLPPLLDGEPISNLSVGLGGDVREVGGCSSD